MSVSRKTALSTDPFIIQKLSQEVTSHLRELQCQPEGLSHKREHSGGPPVPEGECCLPLVRACPGWARGPGICQEAGRAAWQHPFWGTAEEMGEIHLTSLCWQKDTVSPRAIYSRRVGLPRPPTGRNPRRSQHHSKGQGSAQSPALNQL